MASQDSAVIDTSAETNGTAADTTPMHHADEVHQPTIEEVEDEAESIHPAPPLSASVLEAPSDMEAPAPSWAQPASAKSAGKQPEKEVKAETKLDTQSHELFPELGGAPKPSAAASVAPIWSKANGKTNGAAVANGTSGASTPASGTATPIGRGGPSAFALPGRHTERLQLEPKHMLSRAQMKKPLNDILKDINKKSKATVTSSTGAEGKTFFTATGPKDACSKALTDVAQQVGAKVSIKVPIPQAARALIIGRQGSTIKAIQEHTGARIQMPKLEDIASRHDDDDDDMIEIVIEGNAFAVDNARREVLKIVGEKASTVNQKLRGIPAEFYPFIAGPNNARVQQLEGEKGVQIRVPTHHTWTTQPPPTVSGPGQRPQFRPAANDSHIVLGGERSAVQEARAEIERLVEDLRNQLTLEQLAINQGRHQFIVGPRGIPVEEFLAETGCAIILPSDPEDDNITIVGPASQVQNGIERAMDLASSLNSTNIDISRMHRNAPGGASAHARNLTRYLRERKEIERLEKLHDAFIVTPMLTEGAAPWELYSRDAKNAMRAQAEISSIVNGHPPSRMTNVPVNPFFHQHLRSQVKPTLRQNYGVHMVLPGPGEDAVLLVFEGPSGLEPEYQVPRSQPSPDEVRSFQRGLEDARKHILDLVNSQQQLASQKIDVPLKFHDKLKKFVAKEKAAQSANGIPVSVSSNGSVVTFKGPQSAVEEFTQKVNAFLEQEKADEKERGFTMSFDFPQKHANRLIGKGGSYIRELREKFDVEIQVNDGKVELKGPKAKAEAAKSHISSLGKQWADEVNYTLKIDPKFHRELIGQGGSQIHRLQDRYHVEIYFPRFGRSAKDDHSNADAASDAGKKSRRVQAEDEVTIRGPTNGADKAREEILNLLLYLNDTGHTASVTVPRALVPTLIGTKGATMDALRLQTGARIDVSGSKDAKDSAPAEITIKGTKAQVAEAKKLIEEKKNEFESTVTKSVEVDKKHHGVLIGPGGSTLRDIVVKAGGSDARMVRFPKANDGSNVITVEGNQDVVAKVIAAIQAIVTERDSQVTEVVDVPTEKHRSLIGRGGQTKKDIEAKFSVALDVPKQGSGQTGVKIIGLPENVEKAKVHVTEMVKEQEGETVQVPKKVHHLVSENGRFFSKLRNDHQVSVDHAGQKAPPKPSSANARVNGGTLPLITDDEEASADAHTWKVVDNVSDLEGDIPWVLRGNAENVAKAKTALNNAIAQALKNTSTGYLVLPDPSTYRYVIGQGGSKVTSIRNITGCKIQVPQNQARDKAIEISGTADGVEAAKELILQAVKDGKAANGPRA